ncbi:MAG: hypothetical protein RLZZ268_1001 [Cyanobacteriota bacterium]|jgi:uncharacterized membrane protein
MLNPDTALFSGLEQGLAVLARALRSLLEALSLGTVLLGLLVTLRQAWMAWRRRLRGPACFRGVRLTFGSWLAMALEFQLGADIVATSTSPTGAHLVQLAVVAVIRTLLNVFLARDLESEQALQASALEARS